MSKHLKGPKKHIRPQRVKENDSDLTLKENDSVLYAQSNAKLTQKTLVSSKQHKEMKGQQIQSHIKNKLSTWSLTSLTCSQAILAVNMTP